MIEEKDVPLPENEEIIETPDPATSETEEGEQGNGDDSQAAPRRNKVPAKKRIKELTKAYRTEAREKEYWREQALKQPPKPEQAPPAQEKVEGKPTLAQFNYDQEQYLEALSDWKVERKLTERDKAAKERADALVKVEQARKFQTKLEEFEERNPGAWAQIAQAPMVTSPAMLEYVQEADNGIDVAHYLSQHIAEANSISQMSPYLATKALDAIASKLQPVEYTDDDEEEEEEPERAPWQPPKPPKAGQPKVTRASEPPVTVATTSTPRKPLERWTVEDHIAALRRKR